MNAEIVNISGEENTRGKEEVTESKHRRPSLERSRKKPFGFGEPSGEVTSPYPNVIIIIRLHVHDE